jgi:hypothetical protein
LITVGKSIKIRGVQDSGFKVHPFKQKHSEGCVAGRYVNALGCQKACFMKVTNLKKIIKCEILLMEDRSVRKFKYRYDDKLVL